MAPVKPRPRDADVRPFDRVSLLLDVDRDYSTCYHLQIDQRGCTCEDCWGDLSWNPKWFVAVHSEPGVWQIEAAIPFAELTADPVTLGKTWACNVTRVVLETLAGLARGVLVHFHDIYRPFAYPRVFSETFNVHWQEQYLLQAFLAFNPHFEVLCANHALWRLSRERVRELFPALRDGMEPSGFWFRRS